MQGSRYALYYSVLHGLFEFFGSIGYREGDPLVGSEAVFAGKSPDDVIEDASEVMNDLPGEDGNSQWNGRPENAKDVTPLFKLMLTNNSVNIASDNGVDLVVEILDLFFGPLNFRPASVYRMRHL